jgi:chromosome segregation ATPase
MDTALIVTLGNIFFTPIIVLVTLWVKNKYAQDDRRESRYDKSQDDLLKSLEERVSTCESRHTDREKEIKEIRAELKNRDVEYLSLYKEHTTLKAKYEVLLVDHEELKANYDNTVIELSNLKEDIKLKAQQVADNIQNL